MDEFAGLTPIAQPAPMAPQPGASGDEFSGLTPINPEQVNQDKYGGAGQQVLAGVEGGVKGLLGPIGTGLELGAHAAGLDKSIGVDLSAEAQAGRQEANPWTHGITEAGGLGLGLLGGTGEATLIANAAEHLLPSISSKIGAMALKGAVETGLYQASDEISKAMLGQGDPETPVASALSAVGAATLLGGGVGGLFGGAAKGLAKVGESKMGSNAANWLEDFGNRWKFNEENPNQISSAIDEFKSFHSKLKDTIGSVWGRTGLKADAIEELTRGVAPEQLSKHAIDVRSFIDKAPPELQNYQPFKDAVNEWRRVAFPERDYITNQMLTTPSAADVFTASDKFKRQLGEVAYPGGGKPSITEMPLVNAARSVYGGVQRSLENTGVWGDAGELQAGLNRATKNFLPKWEQMNSTFGQKVEKEFTPAPNKIATYINQLGKPTAEIKTGVMKGAIDTGEKFIDEVNSLYEKAGIRIPHSPVSMNVLKSTYGDITPGSQMADSLYRMVLPNFTAHIAGEAGGIGGAAAGYQEGGLKGAILGGMAGLMLPHAAQIVGRRVSRTAVPALLKVLGSGETHGLSQFLDYAAHADRGAQKINSGIAGLFKAGGQQVIDDHYSEKDREKLRKYVEDGQQNQEIQNYANPTPAQPSPSPTPKFAEGGDVLGAPNAPVSQPSQPPITKQNGVAIHVPEQDLMIQAAKGRINNYLNSIRPQPPMALPFDKPQKDPQKERQYNKVLDLANQPLTILNHIKDGTLTPQTMQHFTQMYPEIYNQLSKKLTERVTHAQLDKEQPPYKTRQAMSLFLKAPLDSSMTPQSIMAAQSVFAQARQAAQQAPSKPKKGTATLSKASQQVETGDQARQQRQQKI